MFRNNVINLCSNIFVINIYDYPRLTKICPLINRVNPCNEIRCLGKYIHNHCEHNTKITELSNIKSETKFK